MATGSLRADVALVRAGLFASRAKAREAIEAGLVTVGGVPVTRAAAPVSPDTALIAVPPYPWVSRAGVKLSAGLDGFAIDPSGLCCLDIGASTGGFTEVLLARGARHVTAVDVGRGQLHPRLASKSRLRSLEARDARSLTPTDLPEPPALLTFDVSFISLRLVLPPVLRLAATTARAVMLVKPQFEAGPARVSKGVVRDPAVHAEVCAEIAAAVAGLGWTVMGIRPSPILGGDGNAEFLLGASR